MKVILPLLQNLDQTEAALTSSTVNEPDVYATPPEEVWNAATNYNVGDIVIRTQTHMKYENIQAGVNATPPEEDAALETPTRWVNIGPTNKYAMFDALRNSQTETTSPLTVGITPGERIDAIGVFGIDAENITITMENNSVEVYSYTENLNTRKVLDWYDYFFAPFSTIPSIIRFDLPPFTAGVITITLTSSTGVVACGAVIIGSQVDLGDVVYGAQDDELNFSRIERDFDGTAQITQRRSIPKLDIEVWANKADTDRIRNARRALNAVPTAWSGLDANNTDEFFETLLILGIYKRWERNLAHPTKVISYIELEEL